MAIQSIHELDKATSRNRHHKKGISTLAGSMIIVVIAAVALGGAFVYQSVAMRNMPTPVAVGQDPISASQTQVDSAMTQAPLDQPTDWQTYTNDEYGFELNYPQNWYEEETLGGEIEFRFYALDSEPSFFSFVLNIQPNSEELSPEEFISTGLQEIDEAKKIRPEEFGYTNVQQIFVAGIPALHFVYHDYPDHEHLEIIAFAKDSSLFQFRFPTAQEAQNNSRENFAQSNTLSHQIISTFEFTPK